MIFTWLSESEWVREGGREGGVSEWMSDWESEGGREWVSKQ